MDTLVSEAARVLSLRLFTIGSTPVTVASLLLTLVLLLGTLWGARLARRLMHQTLTRRGAAEDSIGTVSGLVYYGTLIVGFAIALNTAGIQLGALFAAGAFFAVGLGFAMQSIAENFVAGVILLMERSIKPGDSLEVEGVLVKVQEMGIRSCVAQSRDGEDLIIPNSVLIRTTVKSYTLRDRVFRVRIPVGVTYDSDMTLVASTLLEAAQSTGARWPQTRAPSVLLTGFGDNSVTWDVGIWIDTPWEHRVAASDLHSAVWAAFKARGIVIAYPQRDIHLDPDVSAALKALAAA